MFDIYYCIEKRKSRSHYSECPTFNQPLYRNEKDKHSIPIVPFVHQVSMEVSGTLSDVTIEACRRKHLGYLLADQGALVNPEKSHNLPKQVGISSLIHVLMYFIYIYLYIYIYTKESMLVILELKYKLFYSML